MFFKKKNLANCYRKLVVLEGVAIIHGYLVYKFMSSLGKESAAKLKIYLG
jgi:hypothetical protein